MNDKELLGCLIGLIRAIEGNEYLVTKDTEDLVFDTLVTAGENDVPSAVYSYLRKEIEKEKKRIIPDCYSCAMPCGRNSGYDMACIDTESEEIRNLKYSIIEASKIIARRNNHLDFNLLSRAMYCIGLDNPSGSYLSLILGELNSEIKKD